MRFRRPQRRLKSSANIYNSGYIIRGVSAYLSNSDGRAKYFHSRGVWAFLPDGRRVLAALGLESSEHEVVDS